MNVEDLVTQIARKTNRKSTDVKIFVNAMLEVMKTAVLKENIKLRHFGSFMLQDIPERTGVHPQTHESIVISARKRIKFIPSREIQEALLD